MKQRGRFIKPIVMLIFCGWLSFVQPGLSAYWLIEPQLHARLDAADYDQLPDGEPLPGHPVHAPHQHPISFGIGASSVVLQHGFDAGFYRKVFSPAGRLALLNHWSETGVIAKAVNLEPPEQPPRA